MIANFPETTRRSAGETVSFMYQGTLYTLPILSVKATVTDVNNDATAEQSDIYRFANIPKDFSESEIFKTKNLVFKNLTGSYLGFGAGVLINSIEIRLSTDVDLSGYNFTNVDLSGAVFLSDAITDGANFEGALFPADMDTKAEFAGLVASYDPITTIWTDGDPIGEVTAPTSNITVTKYQVGQTKYFIKANDVFSGIITKIESVVTASEQSDKYFLSTGERGYLVSEVFPTQNLALVYQRGTAYLNQFRITTMAARQAAGEDLSGFDFTNTNFNTNSYNFSGVHIEGSNFTGATLPNATTTKGALKALVASYDENTKWTDGTAL